MAKSSTEISPSQQSKGQEMSRCEMWGGASRSLFSRCADDCLVALQWRIRADRNFRAWLDGHVRHACTERSRIGNSKQASKAERHPMPWFDSAPGARGQAVDRPLGALGVEIATDLVELLGGIAHHLAHAATFRRSEASSRSESLRRAILFLAASKTQLQYSYNIEQ